MDDAAPERTVRIGVRGAAKSGAERCVSLRVTLGDGYLTLGDGYPSHVSPRVEATISGAEGGGDAARLIEHELRALYYERSAGASVVHTWTEWVRDEWIARRM